MASLSEYSFSLVWDVQDARNLSLIVGWEQVQAAGRFQIRFPLTHLSRFLAALALAVLVIMLGESIGLAIALGALGFVVVGVAQWVMIYENGLLTTAQDLFVSEPAFYNQRVLVVGDDVLCEQRTGTLTQISYGVVHSVMREAGLIIVWANRAEAIIAIPERSFADKSVADAFLPISSGEWRWRV